MAVHTEPPSGGVPVVVNVRSCARASNSFEHEQKVEAVTPET